MKHFASYRLRVEKQVVSRVARILRGKGTLNANVGQIVSPEEIIGNAIISAGFRTLNLSTLLSVPPEEIPKYLVKKLGQRIYKGELLAYKKGGLFAGKKIVTAPTDGVLDFLNNQTGELKIAFLPKKVSLPAGVYGVVEMVDKLAGQVIIRTEVSKVYGILGSGRVRDGILHILNTKQDLVQRGAFLHKFDGHILVGENLFFEDMISASLSLGVNGIITGGINAEDYRKIAGGRLVFPRKLDNDIGIGVIVTEGFGGVKISDDVFEIFQEYEGKFVFINGNKALIILPSYTSHSLVKVKNTKLPLLQNEGLDNSFRDSVELKIGLKVRIVGNSYLGEQGKITAIDDTLTLLPSGIKSYIITVETSRRKLQVPVANLEVIM